MLINSAVNSNSLAELFPFRQTRSDRLFTGDLDDLKIKIIHLIDIIICNRESTHISVSYPL